MVRRTLAQWLAWQESLHARWIDLDLARIREVAGRLGLHPPAGAVFTVGGTNGKGSTVALLEALLRESGRRVAVYTSPHLVRYNERIRVDGRMADDAELIRAFERVEQARGDTPLTFFEFGTLAAFEHFSRAGCDAWVLEVGLGGRLDAVNIIDADVAVITTVDLDHQAFLGNTIEEIAAEKAGIMRPDRPVIYADWPVPAAIRTVARARGSRLLSLGTDFDFTPARPCWSWRGVSAVCDGIAWPPDASLAQLRNAAGAFAAIEQFDPAILVDAGRIDRVLRTARQPGRFQRVAREHEWVLDVAHNPQAFATLRDQLATLEAVPETTIVLGMFADKDLDCVPGALGGFATRWITCTVDDARARSATQVATRLRELGCANVVEAGAATDAFEAARALTAPGGRIVVCGSFRVVGPAMEWLGIY